MPSVRVDDSFREAEMQIHTKLLRCLLAVAVILEVPQAFSCTAWSPLLGTVVNVVQGPGHSPFWAHAMIHPMTGLPTITYGPTFYQLPPSHAAVHLFS
ncbi:hypothetical protein D3C77_307470 [compost metagenome]